MTKAKLIMGLAIGASLFFSFEPLAQATPMAAAPGVVETFGVEAPVVQVVTRAGVAHRSTRRTTRRVVRRH